MLFGHARRSPPQGYQKTTLQQILRADRAVFTKMIQDCVPLRRDTTSGDLPMDVKGLLADPVVLCWLVKRA